MKSRVVFALCCLSTSMTLSGCYCFMSRGKSNVRFLDGAVFYNHCPDFFGGGGKPYQFNAYYGFPNTDLRQLKSSYLTGTVSNHNFGTMGPVGFRAEKYVTPFHIIPVTILGLGIDYSYASCKLNYQSGSFNYTNELRYNSNRVMLSANLYVFVQKKWMGYITGQWGPNFTTFVKQSNDPDFSYKDFNRTPVFNTRYGAGIQYYFLPRTGLTLEAGYGGGAYVKAGFSYWIKLK